MVAKKQTSVNDLEYIPKFRVRFLSPKYWLTWLGVFILWLLMFVPVSFRNKIASMVVAITIKPGSRSTKIATTNISMCFPEKTDAEIKEMVARFFYYKARIFLDYSFLWFASEKKLKTMYKIVNGDELCALKAADKNIIFLTGHMLALDHGAQSLSFDNHILGLIKTMKNPVVDWLVARGRTRFNTRLYERAFGIKGIIASVKSGDQFFYLPDEDLSESRSEFVSFFNVQKATITALGRLAKICNAKVVPCVSIFNDVSGQYEVHFLPSLSDFPSGDKIADALKMNQVLEELILMAPEQYLWTFRFFKNRPPGEPSVY
jgi:lipid A biosynthesis (KDO)2-(lauroyl)-lipid IVA acyltransferase